MKNFLTLVVCVALLVAVVVGWAQLQLWRGNVPGGGVACTMEARICPDGSAVGRTGPNCEFAACPMPMASDYKNAIYTIEGQSVTLVNGRAETETVPSSASKTVTQFFGNTAKGDLNGDGIPDLAFLLTQNSGGSGTFYYVVVAVQTPDGLYKGTNGILLGDRVAPQTTEIKAGGLIVNYAVRKEGEPMSAPPSVGVSKYLSVKDGVLVETGPSTGTVALGKSMLINGTTIGVLELLEDSRCPVDVQCIWAGQLRVRASVDAYNRDFTFTLGTGQVVGSATITLTSVIPAQKHANVAISPSEYRFTFTVTKSVPAGAGTLSGTMTIGPICPVEREGMPCNPSPETYAAHKVYVYLADKKTLRTTLTPDAEGKFSAPLPAGDYWIDVQHQQIGGVRGAPAAIHIANGATATISIDIDTGIR